jgi:gluconokinase
MIIVLMGAAGAGKTTVGTALSGALGWRFIDADALHSVSNIEKIRAGHSLTDADRAPWLARTRQVMAELEREAVDAVIACSALREQYRVFLGEGIADLRWVFLDASAALLSARLQARAGHFAGPAIVASQLHALEPPAHALRLSASRPVDEMVDAIRAEFKL